MPIVTGVDFGTLSVRVTLVATNQGKLGSGFAKYPLHRRKEDPDYATQSHGEHMRALSEAIDTTGSGVIPVDQKLEPLGEYISLRRIAAAARGNP